MTDAIRNTARDFAEREERAYRDFADVLINLGGIEPAVAERLARHYVRKRLAKLDRVMGRISVKHGAYLDRDQIRARAKEMDS